jgi:Uncharacterized conserved protein
MKCVLVSAGVLQLQDELAILNADPNIRFIIMLCASQTEIAHDDINQLLVANAKPVIGGIFPYVIHDKLLLTSGIVLIGLSCPFNMAVIPNISKNTQLEIELQQQLPWQNTERGTLFTFVHGMSSGVQRLIDGLFNQYGLEINYIGGGCGSLQKLDQPCVITPLGILADAAVLVMADILSGIGVAHGWQSISRAFKVTEVEGNEIISIDWRPAIEVYRSIVEDHSGICFSEIPFTEIARAYPFGIAKLADELVIRDPIALNGERIVCVGDVRRGSYVHIMHGKPDYVSAAAGRARQKATENLKGRKPRLMLFMDCISRVLFLGELFAREITHVAMPDIPLIGALTLGEIANSGYDYLELYNKTSVVGLLASDTPRIN